ncbi:sulfite dehydrogenase (cytochrome) subunit SorA apoprotein [Roseovarius nanhaiticus]|uniref:Sulfite dehydrogenase (Cytochrome) subunit SorA apoprotein n=1 Tax=Roseovarius nanhaiticus TaxID=573024 RepID=A0A1N7HN64_9RHOB|nr:sulfite oxidase [Roseovarius nanhaiticus]SEL36348.1 sulfite dehydrogenase (cytochrome) subunit SorA apoprotein [Roseovarius nanhaiticus]SIS26266.1 sulfite dehydrogenase (cytochrome) subunit SorA apoprotein [Roseovarius nanhaiticus]
MTDKTVTDTARPDSAAVTEAAEQPSRRAFLATTGLTALGAYAGMAIPNGDGLAAFAQASGTTVEEIMAAKDGLVLMNDRPLNMETPAHLLDADVTPYEHFFVRNNGMVPETALDMDAEGWTLTIDGEVDTPLELSLDELKERFETVTQRLVLECGGNGRAYFNPGASGNQWTTGAVACADWTGVRLSDVLNAAGVKDSAVYTAHYGNDPHLSGDPDKDAISRGAPIDKAMAEGSMIAWEMNGEPIPAVHGFPLRVVIPGYPGSASQKFLTRIWIRDQEHDGAKMTGYSYRVPAYPVAPGTEVPEEDMVVLTEMPVKSLITNPRSGTETAAGQATEVRGHAWAGSGDIQSVDVSIDFGQTWTKANLDPAKNKFAWQRFRADVTLPEAGYYEVWARATDMNGVMQPPVVPGWNPRGYGNNMQHRIALIAT